MADVIHALTSLAPGAGSIERQRLAVRSWAVAGLKVHSFNHPSEIPALQKAYTGVSFEPVEKTSLVRFGRHYVPITAMLAWLGCFDAAGLIVNADIELLLEPWETRRLRWLSDGGLAYLVRQNHKPGGAPALEQWGIDGFLLHGRVANLPPSFLSMGQPGWDYWLPAAFECAGLPVRRVEYGALHEEHERRWNQEQWRACVVELGRLLGHQVAEQHRACLDYTKRMIEEIRRSSPQILRDPGKIRDRVRCLLGEDPEPKTILELGAHVGQDTAWLSQIPGASVHAFEPDPRNSQPERPNVTVYRMAISDRDGRAPFLLSAKGWGRDWSQSSSLHKPKNHLTRYPMVSFGETVQVETRRLDSVIPPGRVAFIWADVQGAEREIILGGRETLARTRYLFTEFSDDEMYEGQAGLSEILSLLPGWRVLEMWEDDVLLENTAC